MINVLMVLENTGRGGSQAYVMNTIRNLDRSKYHVGVVVTRYVEGGYQDELKELGCPIYVLPYFKIFNYFKFVNAWKKLLTEHKYDIVHGHCTSSAGIYFRVAKKFGCKTVAHSHSAGYRGSKLQQLVKSFFAKFTKDVSDLWLSCSDLAASRLYGKDYKSSSKYHTMPNAICVSNYKFDELKRKCIREKYDIDESIKLYGHIGSFTEPKNHKFLIKIFEEIHKSNPNTKLMLCGAGPLMKTVKQQAEELKLGNCVIFTGLIANVPDYFMAMDAMLFPSLFEGLPISVVEAQATGLPVLHTDVITKEVGITDLVKTHSLCDSAKKWSELALTMGNENRTNEYEVIEKSSFNMQTSVKELESLYNTLMSN